MPVQFRLAGRALVRTTMGSNPSPNGRWRFGKRGHNNKNEKEIKVSDHPITYKIHYVVREDAAAIDRFESFAYAYEKFLSIDGKATLEQVTTKMIVRK